MEFDDADDGADEIAELSDDELEQELTLAAGHERRNERYRALLAERERRRSETGDE